MAERCKYKHGANHGVQFRVKDWSMSSYVKTGDACPEEKTISEYVHELLCHNTKIISFLPAYFFPAISLL